MSATQPAPGASQSDALSNAAETLGYEIVDISGFLDLVETHASAQTDGLGVLKQRASDLTRANAEVEKAAQDLASHTGKTAQAVDGAAVRVRTAGAKSSDIATWVQDVSNRTEGVSNTLSAVKSNNQQIATIATQVNTLAINAKIEAARAGESGRGFAVVAEAINELSGQTRAAAQAISENIETLTHWIGTLRVEAGQIAVTAGDVIADASKTDSDLTAVESSAEAADRHAKHISERAGKVAHAIRDFTPALAKIEDAIQGTSSGIGETHARVMRLIDTSETIVQATSHLNQGSVDAPFIPHVQTLSRDISKALEDAVAAGNITLSGLFDRNYRAIPGTNPEQYLTEATQLFDQVLPPICEPVLQLDAKVVFCAAVDVNGYLPTHNAKFSQPQSDDPVWNQANCRNRRIFDDRVGLKAGRNKAPFLLQVYRRDMGGGNFKMMKDLSAPISVRGQHWGGLRLAYGFE
ncbi:MAG: methyl-accepting chemotaxis protein [Pseudomonadota bacterium]